jgi:hypothetical protein
MPTSAPALAKVCKPGKHTEKHRRQRMAKEERNAAAAEQLRLE